MHTLYICAEFGEKDEHYIWSSVLGHNTVSFSIGAFSLKKI
jgi:hypothetical protein